MFNEFHEFHEFHIHYVSPLVAWLWSDVLSCLVSISPE